METQPLKVVHYLNQFFGGIGGEDKANVGPQVKIGAVGPGRAIQNILGNTGRVVATVLCGDNYFAEKMESATEEVLRLITPHQPELVLAGPAFDAGRYGIACGAVCQAVQSRLGIPTVTGMFKENPGLDLFLRDLHIVETGDSVKGLTEAVTRMVSIGTRLARHQKIGSPSEEGYFPRGSIANEVSSQTGAERVVSMLLSKIRGEPFQTEIPLPRYDRVRPAPRVKDLRKATIVLVTDGGLVPKGNPDNILPRGANRFGAYSIKGMNALKPGDYEVIHTGYDPIYVVQDPNRLVPVDIARDMESEGVIGKLLETFYATAGAISIIENAQKMGRAIAEVLKAQGVDAVILTST